MMSGLRDIELDGELYTHGMDHSDIHSRVSRTAIIHEDYADVEYHIFDIVYHANQTDRIRIINELLNRIPNTNSPLRIVKHYFVDSVDDVMRHYDNFVDDGYEGFVLRHKSGLYERKRVNTMMKFKPKKHDTYMIVGFEEEVSIHGVAKGALGALILDSDLIGNNGNNTRFKVGTGFTREQRIALWQERDALMGKWCKVAYQHITSANHVPRFPVFISIVEKEDII
jgi:ATP-dependent DNA ligase